MKLTVLAASLLALVSPAAAQPGAGTAASSPCSGAVSDARYVEAGGIRQWVTIEGADCANPVVLIVHGGPGNPNTPFAHNLFGGWTRDFTVVNWDQRGSGKTYAANAPAEDEVLTLAQLTRDGIEIARYAAARFGKRKVILMGGSWDRRWRPAWRWPRRTCSTLISAPRSSPTTSRRTRRAIG